MRNGKLLSKLCESQGILVVNLPEDFLSVLLSRSQSADEGIDALKLLSYILESVKALFHDECKFWSEFRLLPLIKCASDNENQLTNLFFLLGSIDDLSANGARSTDDCNPQFFIL